MLPNWHCGFRHSTFHPSERHQVVAEVTQYLKTHPTANFEDIRNHLRTSFRRPVSHAVLSMIFKKMRWSWRIPTRNANQQVQPKQLGTLRPLHISGTRHSLGQVEVCRRSTCCRETVNKCKVLGLTLANVRGLQTGVCTAEGFP